MIWFVWPTELVSSQNVRKIIQKCQKILVLKIIFWHFCSLLEPWIKFLTFLSERYNLFYLKMSEKWSKMTANFHDTNQFFLHFCPWTTKNVVFSDILSGRQNDPIPVFSSDFFWSINLLIILLSPPWNDFCVGLPVCVGGNDCVGGWISWPFMPIWFCSRFSVFSQFQNVWIKMLWLFCKLWLGLFTSVSFCIRIIFLVLNSKTISTFMRYT